jgi:hypothetical protein
MLDLIDDIADDDAVVMAAGSRLPPPAFQLGVATWHHRAKPGCGFA